MQQLIHVAVILTVQKRNLIRLTLNSIILIGSLSGLRQFLAIESPLQIMKNAFYFTLKALFILTIFKFLSWYFGHLAKRFNFKFYGVTTWLKKIVILMLPNISRSKGNQKMKFGQIIEYNMRNIFLEKSYTKFGGKTSPRPCSGKLNLNISLDQ